MPEIRTSAEPSISNDEETTEDSDEELRQEGNDKRGKVASFSDTTLQDIPIEILYCILVKAVAMEVKNMKLAKSVWKEKSDLVISRLGSVCSQWSSVLTTNFFRIELHRALDGIAQEKFRMERRQDLVVDCSAFGITTLKDDIFLFCFRNGHYNAASEISSSYFITVYDRNNMEEVKDIIKIPGLHRGSMATCNVLNCVYVLKEKNKSQCASVLRITKDDDQKFSIHSWISDLRWSVNSISVSDEGGIMLSLTPDELHVGPNVISLYYPNGFLHHEVILSPDIYGSECIDSFVIRNSNANLLLGSLSEQNQMVLTEINTNGIIQRQYQSSLEPMNYRIFMSVVDAFGRILNHDMFCGIEMLDSALNLMESTDHRSDDDDDVYFTGLHFDRERNEVLGICSVDTHLSILRIFSFIEE